MTEPDRPDRPDRPDFDLYDQQLRRARSVKWTMPGPDVLPAWVAEMDVALCRPVAEALHQAIDDGVTGYPAIDRDNGLPRATVDFLAHRYGWTVEPERVISTGDVMVGIILTLRAVCEAGPVVVPTPTYPPFLAGVPWSGHELVTVPMRPPKNDEISTDEILDAGGIGWTLDLVRIEAALRDGARTVLIANPHNPTGRVFTRGELEALRDVVLRYGARVVSDEIHAPMVLPGPAHTPYASLEGTAGHATTLVAATKAWNLPGLKCAQIIPGTRAEADRFRALPPVTNNGVSPLGVIATVAAYDHGRGWLDGLVAHLDARRRQLADLLRESLPAVRCSPPQAGYLAWLDARPLGLDDDPAGRALERARVMVNAGETYGAPAPGFVRLNYGTSEERLDRIVKALTSAWS